MTERGSQPVLKALWDRLPAGLTSGPGGGLPYAWMLLVLPFSASPRLRVAVSPCPRVSASFGRGPGPRCGRLLLALALAVAAVAAVAPGCVRRTMIINTDPQGAAVLLNDQQVGTSPVSVDFTWYGDYDVVLRKDGHETLKTSHRLDTPWYELPGIDLVSEVLMPFTIHDRREVSFTLSPAKPIDQETLLKDAIEFRERTLFGSD